jgi:hypothetical protein
MSQQLSVKCLTYWPVCKKLGIDIVTLNIALRYSYITSTVLCVRVPHVFISNPGQTATYLNTDLISLKAMEVSGAMEGLP